MASSVAALMQSMLFTTLVIVPLLLLKSAVFAASSNYAKEIIKEVETFRNEFNAKSVGLILRWPMKADGKEIPGEYAQFFFDVWEMNPQLRDVHNEVQNFLKLQNHGGEAAANDEGERAEAEAMRKVQTALDVLEMDQEQMDWLGQQLSAADAREQEEQSAENEATHHEDYSSSGGNSDVAAATGKTSETTATGRGGFFSYRKKKPTTQPTASPNSFKTALAANSELHKQIQPVYDMRVKINEWVRRMRAQLWLRQPLKAYQQLLVMMIEDGEKLRDNIIPPFMRTMAQEIDIYATIPDFVDTEWLELDSWYKNEFVFPHDKRKMTKLAKKVLLKDPATATIYWNLATLLKNQMDAQEKWVKENAGKEHMTKKKLLLPLQKINLHYYPLDGLAKEEQLLIRNELYPLAERMKESVANVYRRIETVLEQRLNVNEDRFKTLKSEFNQLKAFDMVNAVSLMLHNELLELAKNQAGFLHQHHHHHPHLSQRQQKAYDQRHGKKKKKTKEEKAEEEREAKMKAEEVYVPWLLANKWLRKELRSLVDSMDPMGSLEHHWNIMLLENARDKWEMSKELEVDVIREKLPGSENLHKRIFYCGIHMLFLYEQLNKVYDFDMLVGAIRDTEGIVITASRVDAQLESETSEAVEKKAMLTPTGAFLYQNAWQAQHDEEKEEKNAEKKKKAETEM